jgi:hypothetical protein
MPSKRLNTILPIGEEMLNKHFMIEFDLAGAEWVVVAYLSQDPNMLEVVKSGKSPHIVTGALIAGCDEGLVTEDHKKVGSLTDPTAVEQARRGIAFPPGIFLPRSMSIRQAGKKSNHGLNYDMRYRRFALENEMTEKDAEPIVNLYRTKAYPWIFEKYHVEVRRQLKDEDRSLTNCFGRKVRLLREWGQELFMAAYSFKPQSTVFDTVRHGMRMAFEDESRAFSHIRLGAQVHDSLMMNHPVPSTRDEWLDLASCVWKLSQEYMRPELIYHDTPFRLGCDAKMGVSWGRLVSLSIPAEPDLDLLITNLHMAYDEALAAEQMRDRLARAEPEWEPMKLDQPQPGL